MGLELLALAQHHDTVTYETRTRATEELQYWQAREDADIFARSIAQGKEWDLETALLSTHRALSSPLSFQEYASTI